MGIVGCDRGGCSTSADALVEMSADLSGLDRAFRVVKLAARRSGTSVGSLRKSTLTQINLANLLAP
jgi:hypothetical protein